MRLVYTATQKPVQVGDVVTLDDEQVKVSYFTPPHHPASSGKVSVYAVGNPRASREYYVSIIGAEWIEREDRL